MPEPLILASSSTYRRALLERLDLNFDVVPAAIDETAEAAEDGAGLALRLGRQKALKVASDHPEAVVIGSDQVAECRGRLLGKPGTAERAFEQLAYCAGHEVVFHTSVALARGKRVEQALVPTRVRLRKLGVARLRNYIAADQPLDCAGSMRSESLGISLAENITSDDPTALIGLPLIATVALLERFGLEVLQ
jgi:septum formation protein